MGMLWRGEFSAIPEFEFAAPRRLRLLHRKLSTTPGLFDRYAKTITDDIDKEYIRKLSQEEAAALCRRPHWFLPHFVVCHPDKPNRPRQVLDCAAKVEGVSLNCLVNSGPNNLSSLLGVLMCYRAHRIVVNADIEEMFPQFPVVERNRDCLAFLWHVDPAAEPDVFIKLRHVFRAKCSPAIANHTVAVAV